MWETLKEVNMMNRYNLYFSKILPHTLLINHPAWVCSTEIFSFPSCSHTVPTNKISAGKDDLMSPGSYNLCSSRDKQTKPKKADVTFTVSEKMLINGMEFVRMFKTNHMNKVGRAEAQTSAFSMFGAIGFHAGFWNPAYTLQLMPH